MFLKLNKGDIVDIIFPATSCSDVEVVAIKNYVKNTLNLTPRILLEDSIKLNPEKLENEFPASDAKSRFLQLKAAFEAKDSKIIWCARGGYGSGDLLPYLEKMNPQKQNKLFIGFSDIVSLGTFLQDKWNWNIICAPVLLQLARGDIKKSAEDELKDLIFGKIVSFSYDIKSLNEVTNQDIELEIFSKVCGGCLSVLAGHFGGKYQIDFEEKILFLEDEGEDGERLDRYFRQIIEVILKDGKLPSAILLGNFLQANPHGTPKAKNIEIAIERFLSRIRELNLQIPIFQSTENNLGHSSEMRPLILGFLSKIVKHQGGYKLVISE